MSVLELQQVTKTFGSGNTEVQALKETNFNAERGELIAIIGPSGSGKSTFLTISGGLQAPSSGRVMMNGQDLTELNEKKRANVRLLEISFVLQPPNLVPFLNVKQPMEVSNRVKKDNLSKEAADELFETLGIQEFLHKHPNDLSGGQRQRVAIAKALYGDPAIILADEPTASLDSDKAFEVMQLLKEATTERGKTTIVVTHDTRLVSYCDKVYHIVDGELSEAEHEDVARS